MIGIIDYGLGNVKAFANVYRGLNEPVQIIRTPLEFKGITRIILPGVGAFDYAMQRLESSGLKLPLEDMVLAHKVPVLGVCVGMQMLARSSEEGSLPGLAWIDGVVKKFDFSTLNKSICVPHMGWNNVIPFKTSGLFERFDNQGIFYFLHSYYFQCARSSDVIATTNYDIPFASAVNSGNIFGVQFHPEKSHRFGIKLLKNFLRL